MSLADMPSWANKNDMRALYPMHVRILRFFNESLILALHVRGTLFKN